MSAAREQDALALARFDLFLLSAVATVLVTRAYLAATGYPQIGGGPLHIAHVLWGGLLMAVALVSVEIAEGSRVRMGAALVGGIGFGLFVDEIGKFVTSDVDYFYRPAIALMYVVFVVFYFAARAVVSRIGLPDSRRIAIAASAVTDLGLGHLDDVRRRAALRVLDGVQDPGIRGIADSLRAALAPASLPAAGLTTRLARDRVSIARRIDTVLGHRLTRRIVVVLFAIQALVTIASLVVALVIDNGTTVDDLSDLIVEISTAVSGVLAVAGLWCLARGPYLRALRLLRASVVVTLLVTQVFLFAQQQWGALIGFTVSILMLGVLRVAIRSDRNATPPE